MNFSLKKILLTTFILLEVSAMFAFSVFPCPLTKGENTITSPVRPKITISFEIARRRDCTGFGICNVSGSIEILRINSCNATLYADETSRNLLIMEITKSTGISATAYERNFKSGIFVVEDDAPIPSDVLKTLGISGSKSFVAGNYKVTEKDGLLVIAIPIK